MNKKVIIIAAVAGLISFAGAFSVTFVLGKNDASEPNEPNNAQAQATKPPQINFAQNNVSLAALKEQQKKLKKELTEKQLKNLIEDVRAGMKQYQQKLHALEQREKRLQITQQQMKEQTKNLNNLKVDLVSTVAELKNERQKLEQSLIKIKQTEKSNLTTIAATYDKMEISSAAKIISNMSAAKTKNNQTSAIGNMDDAVKILFYMQERTRAELLAELANNNPELAATLCNKLKLIKAE